MKPTIDIKPMIHRGSEQIGLYFKNDLRLNILSRKEAGAIWSQIKNAGTHRLQGTRLTN